MSWEYHLLMCVGIALARVVDVSLGTLRMLAVMNGRRWLAWGLGFVEVLVWVMVVSHVIKAITWENWYYGVAYAFGFATGCWVGIAVEQALAHGEQAVRVFTRRGIELAAVMRGEGLGVTVFSGHGKDGPVDMLYIEVKRRRVPMVTALVREMDPAAFYVVDDVRYKSMSGSPDALALKK
jgi:uncharacterized protein YebE (UPF0316 family)